MKKFLLFILTFTFTFSYSQLSTRTIEVKDGQMSKFIEMAGKKTKKVVEEPKNGKVHPVRLSRLERQVADLQELLLKLCIELGVDPEEDNNG